MRFISLLFLLLILLTPTTRTQSQNSPSTITHVILISMDGARPDAIQQVDTPNIDRLAEWGAVTWEARTIIPPVTLPSHASMLTGFDVDEHGITHNDYRDDVMETPTFLTIADDAGYRTAMAVGKNKLEQFHQRDSTLFRFGLLGDRTVVDAAIDMLEDGYEVIFVHLPNPDYFGHLRGWMSESYLEELVYTDYQIGRIIETLDELGLTDSTLIVVTADHGGHNKSHGQDRPEDMLIPWIITGPGVKQGTVLEGDIRTTDTAHTILWSLGLPLPDTDSGHLVLEAFTEEFIATRLDE